MAAENFGGSIYVDISVEKTLADGDNKSFLLMHTELIVAWVHGDDVYIYTFSSRGHIYIAPSTMVESIIHGMVATTNTKLSGIIQL